jgi:hypothetical protein
MADETDADKGHEEAKSDSAKVAETKPVDNPVIPPPVAPVQNQGVGGKLNHEKPGDNVKKPRKILVEIIRDNELKPFEAQTIIWARWGVRLGAATLIVAILTLRVFYLQFKEMQTQTGILNTQAQQAAHDSIEAGKRVERQLELAEKQAGTLADLVKQATTSVVVQRQAVKPIVIPNAGTAVYHLEQTGEVWVVVRVQNNGSTDALSVSVAAKLGFRESAPTKIDYKFRDNDFKSAGTDKILPPFSATQKVADASSFTLSQKIYRREYPMYRSKEFYIWGYTRFMDAAGIPIHDVQFCRYGTAIFDVPDGYPHPYTGTKECSQK